MKSSFNKEYIKLIYSSLPQKLAQQQVSFIIKKLELRRGMKILDIGCGNGRHSLEFARKGYMVTGIDSSKDLIKLAKKNARRENLVINFTQSDMRVLPYINEFDAAISVFSFGFLKNRGEHAIALKRLARSLKNGGKLMLITGNSLLKIKKKHPAGNRRAHLITNYSEKTLSNKILVSEKEIIDTQSMKQTIKDTWKEGKKTYTFKSTMHLFTPNEIKKLLNTSGLDIVGVWSDLNDSRFTQSSNRLLISAIKK